MKLLGQPADQGALPSLYAATENDVQGGTYFGPRSWFGLKGAPTIAYVPSRGRDDELAHELWTRSEALTGVTFPKETSAKKAKAPAPKGAEANART